MSQPVTFFVSTIAIMAFIFGAGTVIFFIRSRREAAASRLKAMALLDEMIGSITAHVGPLEEIVLINDSKTFDDERRSRDLTLSVGEAWHSLNVNTVLIGRKSGYVQLRVHRMRDGSQNSVYWPSIFGQRRMEPWLRERLDRLDQLVGTYSRWESVRRILGRINGSGTKPPIE